MKQSRHGYADLYKGEHYHQVFGGQMKSPAKLPEPIRTARNTLKQSPYARKHRSPLNSVRPDLKSDKSHERNVFQNCGNTVVNQEHRKSIDRLTCDSCSGRGITPLGDQPRFQRNTTTAQDSRATRNNLSQIKASGTASPQCSARGSGIKQFSHNMMKDYIRSQTSVEVYQDRTAEVIQQTQVKGSGFGKENKLVAASSRNQL